ncbi:MAG: four-carbon acid sugar kinase family protein [Planctomycetota bacterium]|jgi:uncharacterized protein YgbK (DUF1537 family)
MIAVIADDFTGAAELAATGLRYGLNAEVQTQLGHDSKADLIVIDTDTRSRTPNEAATQVQKVLQQLQEISPEWIYKKVDSVMRGRIATELTALLTTSNKQKALLVPANPSFGRTISNGRYFINGRPLNETDFANDPEYPASSSDVLNLLGPSESIATCLLKPQQEIPSTGITIGEAETKQDLLLWAAQLGDQTIPAGAADFFAAILESKGFHLIPSQEKTESLQAKTALFVCTAGSRYSHKAIEEAQSHGIPVCRMPPELFHNCQPDDKLLQQWTNDTITTLQKYSKAIVTIDQPVARNPALARKLRHHIAALVENVLSRTSIDELFIEGGATASAIVRRLQWTRFFPCAELAPGIVRMRVKEKQNLYLTIKPGSYPWPKKTWRFT